MFTLLLALVAALELPHDDQDDLREEPHEVAASLAETSVAALEAKLAEQVAAIAETHRQILAVKEEMAFQPPKKTFKLGAKPVNGSEVALCTIEVNGISTFEEVPNRKRPKDTNEVWCCCRGPCSTRKYGYECGDCEDSSDPYAPMVSQMASCKPPKVIQPVDDPPLMDIGVFDDHVGAPGAEYLRSGAPVSVPAVVEALEGAAATRGRAVDLGATFRSSAQEVLTAAQRQLLRDHVDAAHAAAPEQDFKLVLTPKGLAALIGEESLETLAAIFGGCYNQVKIRRSEPNDVFINFHHDHSHRTLQVPLNDDYTGGNLVFLQQDGPVAPPRPAGSFTLHNNNILHGVTAHTRGVRYGLFLLADPDLGATVTAPAAAPTCPDESPQYA